MTGVSVLRFPCLDSTNAEARRRLAQGRAPGFAVVAAEQTSGRGRQGRTWISQRDCGIYLTLTQQACQELAEQGFVSIVAGVAVGEWLERYGVLVGLKWPNDLRVNGRKVGGILCERQGEHLIIGVGINWSAAPEGLDQATTCILTEVGEPCSREQAQAELIEVLHEALVQWRVEGSMDLAQRWWRLAEKQRSYVYEGTQVQPEGLSDRGELIVRSEDGRVSSISCGELEEAPG